MEKKEYIERGDYCKNICRCVDTACDKSKCPLWNAPAADVVEVVRCKDCVWWEARGLVGTIGKCESPHNGIWNEYTDSDDFCSYSKRKNEKTYTLVEVKAELGLDQMDGGKHETD